LFATGTCEVPRGPHRAVARSGAPGGEGR
jgi:hypothetical protein